MHFGFINSENMDDLVPGGFQVIGNHRAMTLPPQRFGAHDGRALAPHAVQQPFDAGAELFSHHEIGVAAEGFIAPYGVWRIRTHPAAPAEFRKMNVFNSRGSQCRPEIFLVEMRQPARAGKTADIGEQTNFLRRQHSEKNLDGAVGVADGPDLHYSICVWKSASPVGKFGARFDFGRASIKLLGVTKMLSPLPRSFYEPSAKIVAPELLGHFLIRNTPNGPCGGAIVETEAYLVGDPACHAAPGETKRNRVMFGHPGHGYVYLIYGFHFCVNAVCRPAGVAEAVLIRAVEATFGEKMMAVHRPASKPRELSSGPGKLCQAMDITRSLDGIDLCDLHSALFIAENPDVKKFRKKKGPMVTTTRIGITKAAALPLRFYLDGSEFVSRRSK